MKRPYQMNRRAESQGRTRQKIVEAAIALHQSKGLGATTMQDVAERANVGRVTVYRHFPDDDALLRACSGTYFQRHPLPDPQEWKACKQPLERLRRGLRETYAYHRKTEAMMISVLPESRELPIIAPYFEHWRNAVDVLAAAWPPSVRGKPALRAALALALRFDTWHLLVREHGLSDDQAAAIMMRLADGEIPGR